MKNKIISLAAVALFSLASVPGVHAQSGSRYGAPQVNMHKQARGLDVVFDVNARSADADKLLTTLNAVNGVAKNVVKETGGKVVFVFHGKEQLAFANKNEFEYSEVMDKLFELKKKGVEFRFCNNAMQGNGLVPADMNGLVTVVPAGYPELALLESQGYKYMFFSY